jgi:hypothetical protein
MGFDNHADFERYRSCSSKTRYHKRKDAERARQEYKADFGDRLLRLYHCKFCSGHHLGH